MVRTLYIYFTVRNFLCSALVISATMVAAAGCKQGAGARCQLDPDCEGALICCVNPNEILLGGTCQSKAECELTAGKDASVDILDDAADGGIQDQSVDSKTDAGTSDAAKETSVEDASSDTTHDVSTQDTSAQDAAKQDTATSTDTSNG